MSYHLLLRQPSHKYCSPIPSWGNLKLCKFLLLSRFGDTHLGALPWQAERLCYHEEVRCWIVKQGSQCKIGPINMLRLRA
jgi:hypothetical protein